MQWTDEAAAAVDRAPFFVRGMIRRRAEEHVCGQGRDTVTLGDVETLRAARGDSVGPDGAEYGGMSAREIEEIVQTARTQVISESRFYEVRVCGGASGCPRSLFDTGRIARKAISIIEGSGVCEAVEKRARGPILRHHKLIVSISGCANSCSQPQIADFGVQGRARPVVGPGECSGCGACVGVCREGAIRIDSGAPFLDRSRCIDCGDCAAACPVRAISVEQQGFSVLMGGKLGRHARLADVLFDLTDEATLPAALEVCCGIFARDLIAGERFADTVERIGADEIRAQCVSACSA